MTPEPVDPWAWVDDKIRAAVLAEREACAKIAESGNFVEPAGRDHGCGVHGCCGHTMLTANEIAAAIRARK